jgi:DNA-binding transcriptional LysR family regulator
MAMLDLDLLRVFLAAAERGGFSQAARALNRTQSAVSMQMKRLEGEVGARLFQRRGRGVQLSFEGEELLLYARRLLALADEAVTRVSQAEHGGTVRLGCVDDYATKILPGVLAEFVAQHPTMRVELETGLTVHLAKRLERDFDLVLAMEPADAAQGRVLHVERPVWATARDRDIHRRDPLPVALYPEGCLLRHWALAALDERRRAWHCAYLSPSVAAVEAAVEAGLAVSVFKRSTVSPCLRILGAAEGFPALPEVAMTLIEPKGGAPGGARLLAELLVQSLGRATRAHKPQIQRKQVQRKGKAA